MNNLLVNNESVQSITMPSVTTLYRHGGLISEISYDPNQPFVFNLLLPFLQQLASQPRWQLWIAPQYKLNRSWLERVGLPTNKIMQMPNISSEDAITKMEQALESGNFSTVLIWLSDVDEHIKARLQCAAEKGNSYGFIMLSANKTHIH